MKDLTFNPADSLVFLAIRVGKLLANHLHQQEEVVARGFPMHCMGVLVDLWTRDGVRQQDLAVSTIKDKASITRALDVLESQSIVLRVPDQEDKRINRIYLTHKGKELRHTLMPLAQKAVDRAVHDIPVEQVQSCLKVLQRMYENLNKKLHDQP